MGSFQEVRDQFTGYLQGAFAFNVAYVGIANNLFRVLDKGNSLTTKEIQGEANVDIGYLNRWLDAAYAFDYVDEENGYFTLTELGKCFLPEHPQSLFSPAISAVLGGHMAERGAGLMKSGERPGESVLSERESIISLFGNMLEKNFSGIFVNEIIPKILVYQEINKKKGKVLDLGCGNGWYLRRIAEQFPDILGIGLDGFDENIRQANELTQSDDLKNRLTFQSGDIHNFTVEEPVDIIALNRVLHHVWDEKKNVFQILKKHLTDGGYTVIWEPNWPSDRKSLKHPSKRMLAFQNFAEHIQGNHFLQPEEIQEELFKVGMKSEVYYFLNNNEMVITGQKVN